MVTPRVPVEVQRVVRAFHRRLCEHFGSRLCDVRLFGSYARGTANENSDVDVFVLLEELDYAGQRDVFRIAGGLFVDTHLLLSPTVFGRSLYQAHLDQRRPLVSAIERQGLRL
jgi:nucleotidyltransferase-like protein